MRRLTMPVAMSYRFRKDEVVYFQATRDDLRPLGEPCFIEGDTYATAGGRELCWAFDTQKGLRLLVVWAEPYEHCMVTADPPDPAATASALRALGLRGMRFDFRTVELAEVLPRGQPLDLVWVFVHEGAHLPPALFSRKQWAEPWLARTRASGTLYFCAFNQNRYEFLRRNAFPEELPPPGSLEAQRFIGTLGERYEYREGRQLEHRMRWQLWRQHENTTLYLVSEFDERSEAEAEKERLERYGRPVTYTVLQEEPVRASEPEESPAPPQALPSDELSALWLFTPEGTHWPTAVFWNKPLADKWLARHAGSGILQVHSVDSSEEPSSATSGEWYEYLEGKPFERGARWQLWRQDDNGGRFVMTEFEKRYEAMAEMETMERRGHKQTYWVAPRETLGGGGV